MASEDLFEEDFSEEIINELEENYINKDLIETELTEEIIDEQTEEVETEEQTEEVDTEEQQIGAEETTSTEQAPADNETAPTAGDTAAKETAKKAITEAKLFQLPLTRIRNIMKLDPDLHIASNEAVFCVTRATELFIESLARESYSFTAQAKKKTVQKRDVDFAIEAVDSLMFLEGALNF